MSAAVTRPAQSPCGKQCHVLRLAGIGAAAASTHNVEICVLPARFGIEQNPGRIPLRKVVGGFQGSAGGGGEHVRDIDERDASSKA